MSAFRSSVTVVSFVVCVLLGSGTTLYAQRGYPDEAGFRRGDYTLAAGVGYGLDYGFAPSGVERPAYAVMLDRGGIEVGLGTIGLGGIVAYKDAEQEINEGRISSAWSCVTAAGRASLHVTALSAVVPALDLYGGVMAGVQYWHYTDNYSKAMGLAPKERGIRPISAPFVGLKFNLTRAVGVWTELGWDVAAVKGGMYVNL